MTALNRSVFDAMDYLPFGEQVADSPAGYSFCATENGTCNFGGTQNVAYGAGGVFYYQYGVTGGSIACNNATFGDPRGGYVKSCYEQETDSPAGYSFCATENGTCNFSGTQNVAYGAGGVFYYQYGVTGGSIACTNATFGDPRPGYAKSCYVTGGSGGGNGTAHKFTGYERDSETGNDYASARYYGSREGSFFSTDPIGGDPSDPQSLNRYTYVRNNPVNLIDPSGLCTDPNITICVTATGSLGDGSTGPAGGAPGSGDFGLGGSGNGGGPPWPVGCEYSRLCMCHFRGNCGIVFHFCTPQSPEYCPTKTPPPAPQAQAPNNAPRKPWYNTCGAQAAANFALHGGVDAIGLLPGVGGVSKAAVGALGLTAGYGVNLMDVATPEGIGATGLGLTATGTALFIADANKAAIGKVSADIAEAIPGVGTLFTLGQLAYDGYKAYDQYETCTAGGR